VGFEVEERAREQLNELRATVLVDARNVLRSQWPNVPEEELVRRCLDWARRHGRAIRIVVVERDRATLALARHVVSAYPEVLLVQGDAAALPFHAHTVDIVASSLTLHHLEPEQAVAGLREMTAAARIAVVVNDLLRRRLSLALVWLATRLLRCHPISRHDGPLSVRRSYSRDELRALAARAGARRLTIRQYPVLGRLLAVLS